MRQYLEKILEISGVKGVASISKDGLIMEKIFFDSESEVVSAMVAKVNQEMENALGKASDKVPIFATLYAEKGEIVFIAMDKFIVFVLCEKNANIGVLIIQVKEIAGKILEDLK